MKIQLPEVTQVVIDCVDTNRAIQALEHNKQFAKFATSKLLTSLETSYPHTIKIPHIGSIQEYSIFCIKELHKYFKTKFVLVAQHDGFIVNPRVWTHQFLKYDYIGAPWPDQLLNHGYDKAYNVGNGGFSLRSRRLQQEIAKPHYVIDNNEDVIICQKYRPDLEELGMKFAPFSLAKQFSREFPFDTDPTFGQHANFKFS